MNRKLISGRWVRWDDTRARLAYENGTWSRETLADRLKAAATTAPQRILLVDGSHRIDSRTLYSKASTLAQAMLMRVPPGSVISFMLPNWHEAAVIYLAATLAGMVVNPILPSLRDRELLFILKDLETRLIFVPANFRQLDYVAMLSRVSAQMDRAPEVIVVRGDARTHTSYATLFEIPVAMQALPSLEPDAVRMVLYTSGTTGRSKGVLHSHNSIHALIRQIRDHWLVDPGDRFLVPSPIGHIGGSIYAFECPLLLGTTAVLMDQWNADEAVKLLVAEGCTHMAGATPFLQQLLAAAEHARTRLPSLKLFVCGGASVPPSLIQKASDYFEHAAVTRVYGSTEVPITTVGAVRGDEAGYAAETDGRVGLADVKLVDSDGIAGGAGEILARGPQMLVGYLHAEDEVPSFDEEGYFRTGDLAAWVDENYLVVTGRAKDIIIRNGENISPKEIEDLLGAHPEIAEVSIVGVPDARTGERACAVIVPKAAPGPTLESLRIFLQKEGLATFKFPEKVVLWDSLPKNDAGKVLKHQIRASLKETS
jgi:acyl-CoA synthetase (AMP-forming)/AMP-acid ligase II